MQPSHVVVKIDGKSPGELSEDSILEKVVATQEVNEHWWCEVEIRKSSDERFPIEDCLGKPMQVDGVNEAGESTTMFKGFVLRVKFKYEMYGSYRAIITGVTESYKLDVAEKCAFFATASISDIATELAGEEGLDAHVQAVTEKDTPQYYTLWNQTPFQFLKKLADDHGAIIRPGENAIQINGRFDDPRTKLEWRKDGGGLIDVEVSAELRPASMNGAHYNHKEKKAMGYAEIKEDPEFYGPVQPMVDAVKAQSEENLPPGYVGERARVLEFSQYEDLLKKESVRSQGAATLITGSSRNGGYYAGDEIEIEGVFDAGGTYGVLKVVNTWTRQGFINKFWLTPWKNFTNRDAPKPQKWHGVVSAHVAHNVDNAAKVGRAAIHHTWSKSDQPTPLVRMAQPHAGKDRGMYFIPEMGDEVLVSFEDGDPERPRIIGCLWNGVDKPPTDDLWGGEYDENDSKCIVTKSGNRIRLSDKEGKEAIVISTPNKNRMTFMEASNENGRPSIMLHSDGDIFFSAGGRIHLKSANYSREVG